jgi:hypothetical protein
MGRRAALKMLAKLTSDWFTTREHQGKNIFKNARKSYKDHLHQLNLI